MPTIQSLLDDAHRLGVPTREAELLIGHVLELPRSTLRAFPERSLDAGQAQRCRSLLARRGGGEPVAQLTGEREFWSLSLAVNAHALIPRPDTETLVETALSATLAPAVGEAAPRVLDLGTGTGAVALAIASERPAWVVTATDLDPRALALAAHNAARLGLQRVCFLAGDWWMAVAGRRFHLVVSNPPYLAEGDPHLRRGDLRFEPRRALVAGEDGLDAIRAIAARAREHLEPGGWLALEHGFEQGPAVRAILAQAGLSTVFTEHDLAGRERVTAGRAAA